MIHVVGVVQYESYLLKNISFSDFHFVISKEPEACFSLLFTIFQVQAIYSDIFFPDQIATFESYFDCPYDTHIFKRLKLKSWASGIHAPAGSGGTGRGFTYIEGKAENIAIVRIYFFVIQLYFRSFSKFTV